MRVNELDKQGLVELMKSNGDIHRYDREKPTWKRAFELIRMSGFENMTMECQSCVNKVHEWLKK